jgi:hypothetical protein
MVGTYTAGDLHAALALPIPGLPGWGFPGFNPRERKPHGAILRIGIIPQSNGSCFNPRESALVTQAMEDLAVGMAVELRYESLNEPAADDAYPSHADIAHALREPVSAAAVMDDPCMLLRIESLALVWMALHGYQQPPNAPESKVVWPLLGGSQCADIAPAPRAHRAPQPTLVLYASRTPGMPYMTYLDRIGWPIDQNVAGKLFAGWLAVLIGIVVHIAVGVAKQLQSEATLPPIIAVTDFLPRINASFWAHYIKIFLSGVCLLCSHLYSRHEQRTSPNFLPDRLHLGQRCGVVRSES